MKKILFLLLVTCVAYSLLTSCELQNNKQQVTKSAKGITYNQYQNLSITQFFEQLAQNHYSKLHQRDKDFWSSSGQTKNIDINDSENIKTIFKLKILHKLFTSSGASNGAKGAILNIPYFWHWTNPNPRHQIKWVPTNQLLTDIKPNKTFSKYKSIADIDRTPYLFLADLVKDKPQYYHNKCDTFATFGWCSEREMAFVCLTELLGYRGKVVASGNHSWSEFIVKLKNNQGQMLDFCVTIDNTFGYFNILTIKKSAIGEWNNYFGNAPLSKWYNDKAHSKEEQQNIKKCIVATQTATKIEQAIFLYFER